MYKALKFSSNINKSQLSCNVTNLNFKPHLKEVSIFNFEKIIVSGPICFGQLKCCRHHGTQKCPEQRLVRSRVLCKLIIFLNLKKLNSDLKKLLKSICCWSYRISYFNNIQQIVKKNFFQIKNGGLCKESCVSENNVLSQNKTLLNHSYRWTSLYAKNRDQKICLANNEFDTKRSRMTVNWGIPSKKYGQFAIADTQICR